MPFLDLLAIVSDPDQSAGTHRNATEDLAKILYEITGIDDDLANDNKTILYSGLAISAKDAARCILDTQRTSKFFQGILSAVETALLRFPNTVINILYAGCGPFATLILPIFAKYSSQRIQITLLDIHQESLDAAKKIIDRFGFRSFIKDYIQTDAVSYKYPADEELHIIITECMQSALEKEPQAAITMNLAPQLTSAGIFIPQHIIVELGLIEYDTIPTEPKNIIPVKQLADLSADHPEKILEPVKVIMPPLQQHSMPTLLMTIEIFDSIKLSLYESGLTTPKMLHNLDIAEGEEIEFTYVADQSPKFCYKRS